MYNSTHLATEVDAYTERVISISIEEINDNGPVFQEDIYEVSVPEDVASQTPLPTLNIKVTDPDQVFGHAPWYQ